MELLYVPDLTVEDLELRDFQALKNFLAECGERIAVLSSPERILVLLGRRLTCHDALTSGPGRSSATGRTEAAGESASMTMALLQQKSVQ